MRSRISFALVVLLLLLPCPGAAQSGNRVTILYDAFGKAPAMTKAWGFSALVEYGGKRILFDTGGPPKGVLRNQGAATRRVYSEEGADAVI